MLHWTTGALEATNSIRRLKGKGEDIQQSINCRVKVDDCHGHLEPEACVAGMCWAIVKICLGKTSKHLQTELEAALGIF